MRYAEVFEGQVLNVILWDGESLYSGAEALVPIPEGESVGCGWSYLDGIFIPPVADEEPPPPLNPTEILLQSQNGQLWKPAVGNDGTILMEPLL